MTLAYSRFRCKILCDQLYLNAMLLKHGGCLHDLGASWNYAGMGIRKQLLSEQREAIGGGVSGGGDAKQKSRAAALASACIAHLTVISDRYVMHYLLTRALTKGDALQCEGDAKSHIDRKAALDALPHLEYDVSSLLSECSKGGEDCRGSAGAKGGAKGGAKRRAGAKARGKGGGKGGGKWGAGANGGAGIKGGAGADGAGDGAAVADASAELPADALRVVRRAASASWDGNTVILLFATADFTDLAFNWAQAARLQRLRNFVLVAMDRKLGEILSKFDKAPGLLLPRVASDAVAITKLNVIGERQRFGLRVLERGLNVLFVDLDAILLRSPEPLLRDGDIIGERIWGRPLSVVKKWGAAICTGFYFVRSNAHTIGIFQETQARIQEHRQKKPKWQSSDQWAINHALDDAHVEWESEERMRPLSDMGTKYWDNASHVGYTRSHRLRLVVLPHVAVARACPILKDGAAKPPASDIMQMRKWKLWQHLLRLVSPHLPLLSHPIFRMRHTPTLPPPPPI